MKRAFKKLLGMIIMILMVVPMGSSAIFWLAFVGATLSGRDWSEQDMCIISIMLWNMPLLIYAWITWFAKTTTNEFFIKMLDGDD